MHIRLNHFCFGYHTILLVFIQVLYIGNSFHKGVAFTNTGIKGTNHISGISPVIDQGTRCIILSQSHFHSFFRHLLPVKNHFQCTENSRIFIPTCRFRHPPITSSQILFRGIAVSERIFYCRHIVWNYIQIIA